MAATITFDQVFTASGDKNGKPWKRWDFKFGDDRYSTFQKKLADKITVGQPATIEFEVSAGSNGYTNRTITNVLSPNGAEATQQSNGSPEAVRTAPVASGRDFRAEAEGKTRCALVSQLLPAMFTALDAEDQNLEGAEVLLDWAFAYVFQAGS